MTTEEEIRELEKLLADLRRSPSTRPQGNATSSKDILRYLIGRPEKLRATTKIMKAFNLSYSMFVERMYMSLGKGWVEKARRANRIVWTVTEKGREMLREE
jgi:predicted transcriptional regulator